MEMSIPRELRGREMQQPDSAARAMLRNRIAAARLRADLREEWLRQVRETFDEKRRQSSRWFILRLAMGYSSIPMLTAVLVVSSYILLKHEQFPATVVVSACCGLLESV